LAMRSLANITTAAGKNFHHGDHGGHGGREMSARPLGALRTP
jgi:hypothetical protein